MIKYFLHNGIEQEGPFSIEELKNKKIKSETPIWFDGLANWLTAGKIEELKDVLYVEVPPPFTPPPIVPPPFEQQKKQTPPPINNIKEEAKSKTPPPVSQESKSSISEQSTPKQNATPPKKRRVGLIILLIVLVTIAVLGVVIVVNNPNSIPGIKLEINTPKPIIVSSRADNAKSGLLNKRVTVYATVQNQGGPGNVLVTFTVNQGGNTYDKSKSISLSSNETQDIDMTFEEVDRISGEIDYHVNVKSE